MSFERTFTAAITLAYLVRIILGQIIHFCGSVRVVEIVAESLASNNWLPMAPLPQCQ